LARIGPHLFTPSWGSEWHPQRVRVTLRPTVSRSVRLGWAPPLTRGRVHHLS
jgi:hypothetical protein